MFTPFTGDIGLGTRLLLQLMRDGSQDDLAWMASAACHDALLAACDYHQVTPLVFRRLQNLAQPAVLPDVMDRLRARFYQISAYNHFLAAKLIELATEFDSQQIPVLALKGPATAMAAYDDLSMRQYEDIDLLIRAEDITRAVGVMLGRGFVPVEDHARRPTEPSLYHEITLDAPDKSYSVDLHWQLAPPYARAFGPDIATLWRRTEALQLPHGTVHVLCREDLFLVLCQHGARHRWWQLKWLFDVAELFRCLTALDWVQIEEVLRSRPMTAASTGLAVLLARELLGAPVNAEVEKILQPAKRTKAVAQAIAHDFQTRGKTNKSAHDTMLGLEQRPLARAKYMAIQAVRFPLRTTLCAVNDRDLEFLRLPKKLHVLYLLIRPLRLFIQHGKGAARRIWSMAR